MAAVLRVKRRNDEEPLEALVLACKRRKTAHSDSKETVNDESITAVLKFAGTLKNQGDNVIEHLTKTLSKEELTATYKQHVVNLAEKARKQTKQKSQESRFKIVNYFRSLEQNDLDNFVEKEMTVIDVEDSMAKGAVERKDDDYVYDLYYTKTGDDMLIDHLVSVHPLQEELVFGSYQENGTDSDIAFESEDSNSESNWRNDYPDSDHSENSICDDDMRSAVRRLNIGDESDLSTDDEDLVYTLAEDDVDNFGYKYAKYKAKMKAEMDDEYSAEAYKSDSNDSKYDDDGQYEDP